LLEDGHDIVNLQEARPFESIEARLAESLKQAAE